jgi:signal peptidase I
MKNNLLVGDYIIGNKAAYRIKTPNHIPYTNKKIPSYSLLELTKPERNDIIVIRLNEFLVNQNYSDKDLIKRIVGLPGETFRLSDNKIFIDDKLIDNFFFIADDTSNLYGDIKIFNYPGKKFSYMDYGPIKIPAKGDTIEINSGNIKFWQPLINFESQGKYISNEGTVITFQGKPFNKYVIKENYYYVLGDNIRKSVDSRILGFIPESAIESKVIMIYLSLEPKFDSSSFDFWRRIRFNRIFKFFN